jgi:hypothetical protein
MGALGVSSVAFAMPTSTHGLAIMISSIGKPFRQARPSLGKRSDRCARHASAVSASLYTSGLWRCGKTGGVG